MQIQPLISTSTKLSKEQIKRYSRHILLPEIGLENQKRIAKELGYDPKEL